MAKNLSRKQGERTADRPVDLDFEELRDADHMGSHFASPKEEFADPEHGDGLSATLDGMQHERAVRKRRKPSEDEPAPK